MSAAIDLGRSTARVSDLSSTAAALRASAGHSISSARIADSLAAACHLWGRSDYTIRRETLVATSQSWGYSCATLGHSLDAALAPFTAAALRSFAAKVRPHPELIGFIMPGNVVSAGLHEFCLALIAGAAVIVKSASAEPLFFARFAGTLAEIDRELADRIAILNWNRSQAELTNAFASLCDCVAAFGDDQTIATLRSQRPIIAFGSRLSGVVAGCDADPAVTSAIARDVSLFEQRGCLSPHHIFVEDRGDGAARALARDLAAALECLTATLPPPPRLALQAAAPIRRARETARWRKFAGEAVELWEGGRLDWTVIYDAAARFCASPGYRTVFVSPFRDRSDLKLRLAPAAGRLEAFALALPAARQSPFEEDLRALGATHLCKPGAMQSPPLEWRHGGGAFLERLLAPSMSDLRQAFQRHLAQTSASPIGLEIARAQGSWLYTADGRRYLDFISGIGVSALGHGHPEVLAAIDAQARRHLHVMVYGEYVIEAQVRLAMRLAELLPAGLDRIYFTNSGAEAIEGALKAARKFSRRPAFVAFDGAYHGDTLGALALAGNPAFRTPFEPLPGPVHHLPFDDIGALAAIDSEVAAVVIEPVQAEGGVRIPRAEFMHALRDRCDRAGALLVFDEVLTGLGRTGRLFALEHFGVAPDIIVLAKALGGGLPLGAFCSRDEILSTLARDPPLGHITTFGGHPLSCAAGLASLDVILRERLCERAARLGNELRAQLIGSGSPRLRAVRGVGLLLGLEFESAAIAQRFVHETIARGVVINWTLNADRVVRLAPPLNIADSEVDFSLDAMGAAMRSLAH